MATLSAQEKISLIKQGLQEVLKENILTDVIEKEDRPFKIYWGQLPYQLLTILLEKNGRKKASAGL